MYSDLRDLMKDLDNKYQFIGMFIVVWKLIHNKFRFIITKTFIECLSQLKTLTLNCNNKKLFILSSFLNTVLIHYLNKIDIYDIQVMKDNILTLSFNYFQELPYLVKRKNNMNEFENIVTKMCFLMENIIYWGLPTILSLVSCIIVTIKILYDNNYIIFIIIGSIIYSIFYYLYLSKKFNNLKILKKEIREQDKQISSKKVWKLNLLQTNNSQVNQVLELLNSINDLNNKYSIENINIEIYTNTLIQIIISSILFKTEQNNLIIIFILNNIRSTINHIFHFYKFINNNINDIDKFVNWYNENQINNTPYEEHEHIDYPLIVNNINVKYDNFFLNVNNQLTIEENDIILLKGKTGVGKTVLVNSLQGLIEGCEIDNLKDNRSIQYLFEYLNQQTREKLPNNRISLRYLLDENNNNDLIGELINIVELSYKFPSIESYDEDINELSGGEKMRISIIITLFNVIVKKKQILILDEPEQGLDEESRTIIINNIICYVKEQLRIPVLIIYHGSLFELINMEFNKIWNFTKNEDNETNVTVENFNNWKTKIIYKKTKLSNFSPT